MGHNPATEKVKEYNGLPCFDEFYMRASNGDLYSIIIKTNGKIEATKI